MSTIPARLNMAIHLILSRSPLTPQARPTCTLLHTVTYTAVATAHNNIFIRHDPIPISKNGKRGSSGRGSHPS